MYSRDLELSNQNVLHREMIPSPVVILSLVDNSLLVYTADNTLYHYLIIPTADSIKLHLCGSITFDGVIAVPGAVRALSWMIPSAQKRMLNLCILFSSSNTDELLGRIGRPSGRPCCSNSPHDRRRKACLAQTKKGTIEFMSPMFFVLIISL